MLRDAELSADVRAAHAPAGVGVADDDEPVGGAGQADVEAFGCAVAAAVRTGVSTSFTLITSSPAEQCRGREGSQPTSAASGGGISCCRGAHFPLT
jgi:hypothetical protein